MALGRYDNERTDQLLHTHVAFPVRRRYGVRGSADHGNIPNWRHLAFLVGRTEIGTDVRSYLGKCLSDLIYGRDTKSAVHPLLQRDRSLIPSSGRDCGDDG